MICYMNSILDRNAGQKCFCTKRVANQARQLHVCMKRKTYNSCCVIRVHRNYKYTHRINFLKYIFINELLAKYRKEPYSNLGNSCYIVCVKKPAPFDAVRMRVDGRPRTEETFTNIRRQMIWQIDRTLQDN